MHDDVLLIAGDASRDPELVEEVARRHPREVTIVIDEDGHDGDEDRWAWDESPRARAVRERLATLLSAVELRTGASVMGRVGDLRAFSGRWFDGIVDPALPL